MSDGDVSLLLLVGCIVSIWVLILFVLLCGRIKAIKSMLMTVYEFEEHKGFFGSTYERKQSIPGKENSGHGTGFLKL
jgi:hypothetical protein